MPADSNRRFLTLRELAEESGLSESTLRRRVRDGSLPVIQPGGRRTRMLFAADVLDQLAGPRGACRAQAAPPASLNTNHQPSSASRSLAGPAPAWKRRAPEGVSRA